MKKGFIFDMDGIIIDSEPLHAKMKLAVLQEVGIELAPEELASFVGRTSRDFYNTIAQRFPEKKLSGEALATRKHQLYLEALASDTSLQPITGIAALLQRLQDNSYTIGLASSSGLNVIELVLQRFQIRHYFQCITSGTEVPESKPHPAVYLLAAQRLGLAPSQCTVVEDATAGVKAAKAAGMYCIGCINPNSGPQNLQEADQIIHDYNEISLS